MTDSKIKPALQPDEWERALVDSDNGKSDFLDITYGVFAGREDVFLPPRESSGHALAALALYGQPFGFTPFDVGLLKWAATYTELEQLTLEPDARQMLSQASADLRSLADRIQALLPPPEEPK